MFEKPALYVIKRNSTQQIHADRCIQLAREFLHTKSWKHVETYARVKGWRYTTLQRGEMVKKGYRLMGWGSPPGTVRTP